MFCLHATKNGKEIIILGQRTFKTIETEKDRWWDGESEKESAEKLAKEMNSRPENQKFWDGDVKVVQKTSPSG
jgi:hypothetical protein